MENKFYLKPEDTAPGTYTDVKLLISCPKKGKDWVQTTTGFYKGNGKWLIRGFEGECYKVVGWAPLSSKTENHGTESI